MLQQLRVAVVSFIALTLLTGVLYPLVMTGLAQTFFPRQANGSLIIADGKICGSTLIGQFFDDSKYFWPRPSATSPFPYNAASSSGSNDGPLSRKLEKNIESGIRMLREADPQNRLAIPEDLVTTSGSGLDPDISPAAAFYQAERIARVRGIDLADVEILISKHIQPRQFGVLGEPRVNVLLLNRALDRVK
jgi:K+-transporting ATPase ATPase C chain